MVGRSEPVNDFRVALEELQGNNRSQIRCLTLLAEDYVGYSGPIVEAIESRLYTVPSSQKLILLYVVDSIVKTRELALYRIEFARRIPQIFLHVFIHGDEAVRLCLYKLRQTWTNIFPHNILHQMDLRIRSEDGAWPVDSIANPKQYIIDNRQPPAIRTDTWRATTTERVQGVPDMLGSIARIRENWRTENHAVGPTARLSGSKRHGDHMDFCQQIKKSSPSVPLKDVDLRQTLPSLISSSKAPVMSVITNFDQNWRTPGSSPVINSFSESPSPSQSLHRLNLASPFVAEDAFSTADSVSSDIQPVAISTETVKLTGIPENNRIFVDGRAHEVIFIHDVAVIERNGLPHRVYFAGPPKNVFIDNIAHKLAFGEQLTVYIDGLQHVLRFGAPSRELYMGDFYFKGVFGGPPIMAHINNQRHAIRLGGPAPEVKIEAEPSHDLYRFMCQRRENKQLEPQQGDQIKDFLSGVLKKVKEISHAQTPPPVVPRKQVQVVEDVAAPIPYRDSVVQIERQFTPSHSLTNFDMKTLRVRYGVFVNALHEKCKDACSQCGLRVGSKSEKYMQHMDWHIKRNLQRMERSTNCRPLYCAAKDWLRSDPEASNSLFSLDTSLDSAAPTAFAESQTVENEKCDVCGEQFVEVYIPDTDKWMLKDCVKVNEAVFHTGCEPDALIAESSMKKEADFIVDDYCVDNFDKEIKSDPVFKN